MAAVKRFSLKVRDRAIRAWLLITETSMHSSGRLVSQLHRNSA